MRSLIKFSKTVRRGSIAGVSAYSCEIASIVFRPLPVMQATVVSLGLMYPCSSNFCVTPVVTPPAVAFANRARGVVTVRRIADGERPSNRRRLLRLEVIQLALDGVRNRRAP